MCQPSIFWADAFDGEMPVQILNDGSIVPADHNYSAPSVDHYTGPQPETKQAQISTALTILAGLLVAGFYIGGIWFWANLIIHLTFPSSRLH